MNRRRARDAIILVLASPLIALALVIVFLWLAIYGAFRYCRGLWLRRAFRKAWGAEGKSVVLVYSESPNWQGYIEEAWLPRLGPYAVTLNYSRRAQWRGSKPLEAKIWEHWAGEREYNPVAIVLPPRGKVTTVRFYQAFRDFKHGKDELLRQREEELYRAVLQLRAAG